MKIRALKYLLVFTLPATAIISFTSHGWITYLPLLYAFAFIPTLELTLRSEGRNLELAEKAMIQEDRIYDLLLYLTVPIQLTILIFFLFAIQESLSPFDYWGRVTGMGMLCGVFGINVAHELGHRSTRFEQTLAEIMLTTSLYMHFFIEHNRGHHKNVSTEEDPASARRGEWVYLFWVRSIIGSYIHAWQLESQRLKRKKVSNISWQNEMLRFHVIQGALLVSILFLFSAATLFAFAMAAFIGILLLETVNYIEHYGLSRQKVTEKRYENVTPKHSWNSNHLIGRMMLFELSRHSDHHHQAAKPYQLLDHIAEAPQMPTGYPGMMLLSLVPPVWFAVMHQRIKKYKEA